MIKKANIIIGAFIIVGLFSMIAAEFVYFKGMATKFEDRITQVENDFASDEYVLGRMLAANDYYNKTQQEAQQAGAIDQQAKLADIDMKELMDDDAIKGADNALVTIVEFSDYECPYCGRYVSETYPLIAENYIDTGKINYVFRDLPLSFHENSYPAALAAECVGDLGGDSDYYKMHDLLFSDQQSLNYDTFEKYADEIGIDTDLFKECFDNDQFKDEIAADSNTARELGINGTPGFIINGEFVSGALPYSEFEKIIEAKLQEQE